MPYTTTLEPFRLRLPGEHGWLNSLLWPALRVAERALGFPGLNRRFAVTQGLPAERPFAQRALDSLGVQISVSARELESFPRSGAVIVVANHPFGGLDGLILTTLLLRVRPDSKLLANWLLRYIPGMEPTCIFVDPFGGPGARVRNHGGMKSALRWLREGHVLGVFPSGEVSHYRFRQGCVTDPPWSASIARLVQASGAAVVPVHFEGRNSATFQAAGLVHPRLRTVLLPREILRRRAAPVRVQVGHPIAAARLAAFSDPARLIEYLRMRTYLLKNRARRAADCGAGGASRRVAPCPPSRPSPAFAPVAPAPPQDALVREVAALDEAARVAGHGALQVYCVRAEQIPLALREIGRLREITFRQAGEGTGRPLDLDRFDRWYRHLFLWDAQRGALLGAYRLGLTDELLPRFGSAGLYTSTLFRFDAALLAQLDPAIELGRSFVVAEQQRSFAPLMLLWKGIGRFVARHPRYRRLFGAVSISDEYLSTTKRLLMRFLEQNRYCAELAGLVHSRTPPRLRPFRDWPESLLATAVRSVDEVDELVSEMESDRRGVPVLLRQYLKLNGRLLGFNVDPAFGDVLDGLILIDLCDVPRATLDRYLGRHAAAGFLALHSA